MNKKMRKLYAEIEFLNDWIKDLTNTISQDPAAHTKEQRTMTACVDKINQLHKELNKERKAYHNQPLWKKLITK